MPVARARGSKRARHEFPIRAIVVLAALAVSACAGAPPATYDLTAPADSVSPRDGRGQLVVSEPQSAASLDSERILVRPHPTQIAYLTGAQWSERLPALLQDRIIQTFENVHLLRSVGRPGDHVDAEVTLESEIRAFEIDVERGLAVVEISAKLVRDRTGKVVATQLFSAQVPAKDVKGPAAAAALNDALAQVLRQLVGWAATRI